MKVDGIINALECCLVDNNDWAYTVSCDECAFGGCVWEGDDACRESCSNGIAEEAIHVIASQEAEIEQLTATIEQLTATKEALIKTYRECQIELLTEFAARLKERQIEVDVSDGYGKPCSTSVVTVIEIDNTMKEMVGDEL